MLEPITARQWDWTAAAHLLNRAGFGEPPAEIDRLVELGPDKAVSTLVDFEKIPDDTKDPDWAKPDPERFEKQRAARQAGEEERRRFQREQQQLQRQQITELRGWWLRRMAQGPRPLQEKLVLFWHGHFATSMEKVRDAYLMWRQNELFRRLAAGNWLQLLVEAGKDPAMLIWLDQAQSRRQKPNENFAREVMELFALGEGHYTERDITEAARAFTGWTLDPTRQRFVFRANLHDAGSKTIFGQTGNFNGEDVLRIIVAQPQAARFITARLWHYFAGEMPSPELNQALATVFRQGGNQFKPVLRAMFRSEEFYAPSLIRNQVKSPVQWLVGTVRMLESELPPPLACWALTRNLGQDLFAPPNVKGWDGGLSWITTNNLLSRYNQAATLVQGDLSMVAGAVRGNNPNMARRAANRLQDNPRSRVDVERILTVEQRTDKAALIAALEKRLLQSALKPRQAQALRDYLDDRGELDESDILGAIRLVMSTPEYQLT
ncbi:MAG: DUF1800 domain-containing protein [Verrucomicrobiae bacterium]|nr:DUF1800 domain-containing protein [Verrucomicrobiae bacterium]